MNNLIGVSGKIGSGKDLVGSIIQVMDNLEIWGGWNDPEEIVSYLNTKNPKPDNESTYQIKKYADKLKDIVCLMIGCTRADLEDREFKEKPLGEEWNKYRIITKGFPNYYVSTLEEAELNVRHKNQRYVKVETTPRLLLQLMGTECGRQILHPQIWINALFADWNGDVEEWRDIVGHEGVYQVSSFGRVKGLARKTVYGKNPGDYHNVKEKMLKPTITGKYLMIRLAQKNSVTIHSLVANAFLEEREGVINHKDHNPTNNFHKNLERVTYSENTRKSIEQGVGNVGERQADSKLTELNVAAIRQLIAEGSKQRDIATQFSVSETTISDIKLKKKWSHVGRKLNPVRPILPIEPQSWIITDCRFPDEVKAIEDRGGIVIRLSRANDQTGLSSSHESETALDNHEFEHHIQNDGSIEELVEKVKQILTK